MIQVDLEARGNVTSDMNLMTNEIYESEAPAVEKWRQKCSETEC